MLYELLNENNNISLVAFISHIYKVRIFCLIYSGRSIPPSYLHHLSKVTHNIVMKFQQQIMRLDDYFFMISGMVHIDQSSQVLCNTMVPCPPMNISELYSSMGSLAISHIWNILQYQQQHHTNVRPNQNMNCNNNYQIITLLYRKDTSFLIIKQS